MSELELRFESGPADAKHRVKLSLYREKNPKGPPVLLLHGASASSQTFERPGPGPDGRSRSLVGHLLEEGFEPWLLDWRGSGRVVDEAVRSGTLNDLREQLDFDHAAHWDIPQALEQIGKVRDDAKDILAIGHCMGAGTLAQAIAGGFVSPSLRLKRVVLLTLGLFYEPPFDSRLKTQDHALDQLLAFDPKVQSVDPRPGARWPDALEEMYCNWPTSLRPHQESELPGVHEMCNRLSFMYGTPYLEHQLVPEIHDPTCTISFASGRHEPKVGDSLEGGTSGAAGILREVRLTSGSWKTGDAKGALVLKGTRGSFEPRDELKVGDAVVASTSAVEQHAELLEQFGAIPIKMYVHGARNARRRWAAGFECANDDVELLAGRTSRDGFNRLESITLITGAKNQLWHRDSIDRMNEWLRRSRRSEKVIVPDYGHQDLLWGRRAREVVFDRIVRGLRP